MRAVFIKAAVSSVLLGTTLAITVSAVEQWPPWWNTQWAYRIPLEVRRQTPAALQRAPDTAIVQYIMLCGRARSDGADLRIVDAAGQPVNFRIVDFQPAGQSVLQMQIPHDEDFAAWLYFGNTDAFPVDTMNFNRFAPHWEPKVLVEERTYMKKTPGRHPRTLAELKQMIAEAGPALGARFHNRIESGYNLFGESDHYISTFEGYFTVDIPGTHEFRLYANDGGWLLINGVEKIAWPGPRESDEDRFSPQSRAVTVEMERGIHRIQVFHEEGEGNQIAFIRWKSPLAEHIDNVPRHLWVQARWTRILPVEALDNPVAAQPAVRVRNQYWIPETEHQINWVAAKDESAGRAGPIIHRRFEMDDGTVYEAAGTTNEIEHVFFSNGPRTIRLTVTDEAGNSSTAIHTQQLWHVNVNLRYEIGPQRDPIARLLGNRAHLPMYLQYLEHFETAPEYNLSEMNDEDLWGYLLFWHAMKNDIRLLDAAAALIARRPKHPEINQIANWCVEAALRSGYKMEMADEMLKQIAAGIADPHEKAFMVIKRASLLTWGQNALEQAEDMLNALISVQSPVHGVPNIRRQALSALGDIYLLRDDGIAQAHRFFERAQRDQSNLPQAARLAQAGSSQFAVEDFLARNAYEDALELINRWEAGAPLIKIEGLTMFLRGKTMYLMQPGPVALKYLQISERVNPRALHAVEAVWLSANCLMKMERYEEAIAEFMRLRSGFASTEYRLRATERINECAAILRNMKNTNKRQTADD